MYLDKLRYTWPSITFVVILRKQLPVQYVSQSDSSEEKKIILKTHCLCEISTNISETVFRHTVYWVTIKEIDTFDVVLKRNY